MGQNAPAEAADVFYGITPPTVYVTDPQATGWGATWNGALVVRPPLYADAVYQAGELVATTGHVAQAIASQLPGIVYSNAVSQMTIYTNASGAATSWWQVASGVTNSGTFASGTPGAITNGQSRVSFGAVEVPGRPNFNPSDSALSIFAPAKFIYVDSNVGGFWGIKFRGAGGEGFTDIFGFIANGNTGEIQLGSRWPTYYMSLMSGGETRVRLTKDGKVGIGTTNPSEKFEVVGNCKSSGTNTAASFVTTGTVSAAGAIYQAGELVATTGHVAQAVAGKVDAVSGLASNLWLHGETIVSDSYTNLWWRNVYSNGWHWLVAYTNAPGGEE
jgi:hypothetical protein